MPDEELVPFLEKCKAALGENKWPAGCLVVLDNEPNAEICPLDEEFGQRFRSQEASEALFGAAGLEIKQKVGPKNLGPDVMMAVIWTLA